MRPWRPPSQNAAPKRVCIIRDARVFDPAQGIDKRADVIIEKGQIAAITPAGKGKAGDRPRSIDAAGRLLLPGFVDLHAHLRTPGREDEEDIASGTAAAAAGRLRDHLRHAQHRPGGR